MGGDFGWVCVVLLVETVGRHVKMEAGKASNDANLNFFHG